MEINTSIVSIMARNSPSTITSLSCGFVWESWLLGLLAQLHHAWGVLKLPWQPGNTIDYLPSELSSHKIFIAFSNARACLSDQNSFRDTVRQKIALLRAIKWVK